MNRYSRINSKSKRKSVAIDSSDHLSFPISQTPRPPIISKPHEENSNKNMNESIENEEINGDGEMFGVILSRSRSVSSYKSNVEKERNSSMKRSSSVSSAVGGGYCRIHHRNDYYPIFNEEAENLNVVVQRRQERRKKEKGNILRACIRLLGF